MYSGYIILAPHEPVCTKIYEAPGIVFVVLSARSNSRAPIFKYQKTKHLDIGLAGSKMDARNFFCNLGSWIEGAQYLDIYLF